MPYILQRKKETPFDGRERRNLASSGEKKEAVESRRREKQGRLKRRESLGFPRKRENETAARLPERKNLSTTAPRRRRDTEAGVIEGGTKSRRLRGGEGRNPREKKERREGDSFHCRPEKRAVLLLNFKDQRKDEKLKEDGVQREITRGSKRAKKGREESPTRAGNSHASFLSREKLTEPTY